MNRALEAKGFVAAAVVLAALAMSACGDDGAATGSTGGSGGAATTATGSGGTATTATSSGTGGAEPFALTSAAFEEGGTIPTVHECSPNLGGPGENVSPPLAWTAGPPGTLSYAVVMRDLDFMNLVHWVIYDIPAGVTALPQDIPATYQPPEPAGAKQAELQGALYGYLGPCSPNGVNTYQLTIHALGVDALPGVDMNTTENDIAAAVEAASMASASLSGES